MSNRQRGIVLTDRGHARLEAAIKIAQDEEKYDKRFTQAELSERTNLSIKTIKKIRNRLAPADMSSMQAIFNAFGLELENSDYGLLEMDTQMIQTATIQKREMRIDLLEAVDASIFYGRKSELLLLRQWILIDKCRLVALIGMGGMGKTALSVRLVEEVQEEFDYVIWRSLREAPPVEKILRDLIEFLSDQQEIDLPETLGETVTLLIHFLNQFRCLVVLDNAESVLEEATQTGEYLDGYDGYGLLFQRLGESRHQSCLITTTREKPQEIARLEGRNRPVRSFSLQGLQSQDGQAFLESEGLEDIDQRWKEVFDYYDGNPLALKIAANTIQDLFEGSVSRFFEQETGVFGDIQNLLKQQFFRLTETGRSVMYWLGINREPMPFRELRKDIIEPISDQDLLGEIESLRRRSLIEVSEKGFTLQNVVMEYVTNQYVENINQEIENQTFSLISSHALMKAMSKDYVRLAQENKIIRKIKKTLNSKKTISSILNCISDNESLRAGYMPGNLLNLLCYENSNISNLDLSGLTIRQAYLKNTSLTNMNFSEVIFVKSLFTQTFGVVLSLAVSPDGKLLATGDGNNEVRLWDIGNFQHISTFEGHSDRVYAVTFCPAGRVLASCGSDKKIYLWDVETDECIGVLLGHTDRVETIAFNPNGQIIVSGSLDKTIKVWCLENLQCIQTLERHSDGIRSLAFNLDGSYLIAGSDDKNISIWNIVDSKAFYVKTLTGHKDKVRSIALSSISDFIASGSDDRSVRLWSLMDGEMLEVWQDHSGSVFSVTFSPDEKFLVSGSYDQKIQVIDIQTMKKVCSLNGHKNWIRSLAFTPDGQALVSSGEDNSIRFWDLNYFKSSQTLEGYSNWVHSISFSPSGKSIASGNVDNIVRICNLSSNLFTHLLKGHKNRVRSIAFTRDGYTLASGSDDKTIRLWNLRTSKCIHTFKGHNDWVWSVAFDPNANILASGSGDKTIRLWDLKTYECCAVLQGHSDWVQSIAFSPCENILASSSADGTIKLWDFKTLHCNNSITANNDGIWSVDFSPDGGKIVSGGVDKVVRVWDLRSGECVHSFEGHTGRIRTVSYSPSGKLIASGSEDKTVRIWSLSHSCCIKIFQGHADCVWSVCFSPDDRIIASGSADENIYLWDMDKYEKISTIRVPRPYEGTDITNSSGLTKVQRTSLITLGAIDHSVESESEI